MIELEPIVLPPHSGSWSDLVLRLGPAIWRRHQRYYSGRPEDWSPCRALFVGGPWDGLVDAGVWGVRSEWRVLLPQPPGRQAELDRIASAGGPVPWEAFQRDYATYRPAGELPTLVLVMSCLTQ